tara:strand:- start:87 stop:290 length:204 start_codon:yes stop_codon:yes gene_type:complete
MLKIKFTNKVKIRNKKSKIIGSLKFILLFLKLNINNTNRSNKEILINKFPAINERGKKIRKNKNKLL